MKSEPLGRAISPVEVTNISPHGIWMLVNDEELFLPFDEFPWFREASVSAILNVELRGDEQLHWPALDVDLTLQSIRHPDRYPLVATPPERGRKKSLRSSGLSAILSEAKGSPMKLEQLIAEKRDEILEIARRHGAENIRLFGSVARGQSGESSDLDILVDVGDNPSPWFPGGLIADLEELLGRRVHVVTAGALHSVIRDRVLQEAVPL